MSRVWHIEGNITRTSIGADSRQLAFGRFRHVTITESFIPNFDLPQVYLWVDVALTFEKRYVVGRKFESRRLRAVYF